jgi:hypothetical protein
MRITEALLYLPFRGLNPTLEVECASPYCDKKVTLATAAAFPALHRDGQTRIAFFCNEACLTATMTCGSC